MDQNGHTKTSGRVVRGTSCTQLMATCAAGMNPDRPAWKDGNKPTDAEKLRAIEGFFAYCGRYEIDVANHAIYHYPEVAWMPNFVGTKQQRPYTFDGELLTFSGKTTNRPGIESWAITWRKFK